MGLFNNEYRIVVGVSTQQLVKGKYSELRDTVLDSIINDRNTAQNIKNTLTNGFRASVMKYDRTIRSLPDNGGITAFSTYSGAFFAKTSILPPVGGFDVSFGNYGFKSAFSADYWEMRELAFSYRTGVEYATYYWQNCYDPFWYLQNKYMPDTLLWDPVTNELGSIPWELGALAGKPVQSAKWLGEMDLFTWGPAVYLQVTYTDGTVNPRELYQIPLGLPSTEWIGTDKSFLVFSYGDGIQIYIEKNDLPINLKQKIEKVESLSDGRYLAASSIRNTKVNLVDTPDNDYKRLITRGLDQLGIDIKGVTEQIMSTEDGNDPEIIDDAFIGFGVNVRSTNSMCIRYMYDFFSLLADWRGTQTESSWLAALNTAVNSSVQIFVRNLYKAIAVDGGENNNYQHQIRYTWIERTVVNAVIGDVGTVTKAVQIRPVIEAGGETFENSVLTLQKQVSETECVVIRVAGLMFTGMTYPGAYCYYYLSEYEDDAKNHIHFPVLISILDNYGVFEQGEILKEALMLTVFAKDVVKIPWYLREEFLKAVQIAIIVYSIVTFNPQGATYMEILKQLALDAIKQIIVAKIIGELLKQAVDIFGEKDTQILVAIAIIYGAYEFSFGDSAWAENLLKDTLLAQNALNNIIQDNYNDVVEQIKELQVQYKEAMEEIEKINDEFAPDISHLFARRFVFQINPNEEPEQFFNRTVHNSNIGVASLDYPSSYVDVMLKLPEYEFIKRGV